MPELRDHPSSSSSTDEHTSHAPHGYRITRKGSRYNIIGPEGRIFTKYKSASAAGPRWEELTHTPWPYPSSAYEPGLKLWELGIITREELSAPKTKPAATPVKPASVTSAAAKTTPTKAKVAEPQPAQQNSTPKTKTTRPVKPKAAVQTTPTTRKKATPKPETADPVPDAIATLSVTLPPQFQPAPAHIDITPPPLALPAPRIDLARQTQTIAALRKNPYLLFKPEVRVALQQEVDYHRPYAAWAQSLLKMLARYDARQRSHVKPAPITPETILARHIAWQEHQLQREQMAANH